MKIAFDIHGTIAARPEVFKPIMQSMINSLVEVCIISGPPEKQIREELFSLGYQEFRHFHPRCVYSVVDFLKTTDVKMKQDENGNWWCDDKTWWETKGVMCKHFGIDMIFDNDIRYLSNMSEETKFIHWTGEM